MEMYWVAGGGVLVAALMASFRVQVLQQRRLVRLDERLAQLTAGISLLTDTAEGGLRDIAQEIVRGTREDGGLFTTDDLAKWQVKIEEPLSTTYKGVEVYKLAQWQQGPVLLQALNILENIDVKALGYNTPRHHPPAQTTPFARQAFRGGSRCAIAAAPRPSASRAWR